MFINSAISRRNALTGSIILIAALGLMFTLPFQVGAASPCPAVNDWCTTMTVADAEGDGLLNGYEFDKFGSIVDDTIQPGGANINVWTVHTFAHPAPQLTDYIYFGSNPRVPRGTQVTIEGHTFIADAESDDGAVGDRWDFPSGELPASLVWSAGQEVTVSVKLASPCDNLDNLVNAIVVKNLTGEITQAGDTNLHKIRLDPYKSYLIEAIGVDGSDMLGVEEHPNLTLEDPEIPAIWNARGRSELITYGSKSDGNAIRRILRTDHRTYKIEVSSGNNGTGTYQLKVRGQQHLPDQRRRRRTVPVGRRPRGIPHPLRPPRRNGRTPCPFSRHRVQQLRNAAGTPPRSRRQLGLQPRRGLVRGRPPGG